MWNSHAVKENITFYAVTSKTSCDAHMFTLHTVVPTVATSSTAHYLHIGAIAVVVMLVYSEG
jgi:hypothetical protein